MGLSQIGENPISNIFNLSQYKPVDYACQLIFFVLACGCPSASDIFNHMHASTEMPGRSCLERDIVNFFLNRRLQFRVPLGQLFA